MVEFIRGFLFRGGGWVLLSSLVNKIVIIIIPIIMIRMVSISEYGDFEFAKAIVFVLTPFYCFGLHEALLKFGSEKEQGDVILLYNKLLFPSVIFSVIFVVIINVTAGLLIKDYSVTTSNIGILSFYIVTNGVFVFVLNYYRAVNDNVFYSVMCFVNSILIVCLFFAFYCSQFIYFASYAYVLAPIVTIIAFWQYLPRFHWVRFELNYIIQYIKYGVFIGLGGIVSQIALVLDVIMIGVVLNDDEMVGLYKLITIIPSLILFISSICIKSDFSHLVKGGKEKVKPYLIGFIRSMLLPYILTMLILVLNVDVIFSFLFGVIISIEGIIALNILLVGCFFSFFIRIPCGNILNALGFAKYNVYNAIIALTTNIMLNMMLIKSYNIIGVAIATTCSIVITAIFQLMKLKKEIKER